MENDDRMDGRICIPLSVSTRFIFLVPCRAKLWCLQGFFPRLTLLIPNVLLVVILLRTYPTHTGDGSQDVKNSVPSAPPPQAFEGTAVWQANLQGIQNIMGFMCVSAVSSQQQQQRLNVFAALT